MRVGFIRGLLIPSLASALLWGPAVRLILVGPNDVFDLGWKDIFDAGPAMLISAIFPLGGILTVILPAATALRRRGAGIAASVFFLSLAGVVGGFLWAGVVFAVLGGLSSDTGPDMALAFGSSLGLITAIVWSALNFDCFAEAVAKHE